MEQEELHDNGNFDIEDGSLPEFFNRLIHEDLGTGRRRSIIKLPPYITRSNPDAYIPEVVSIGPYHHGKEHLMPMEACKRNCFASFMKRSKCNPKRCYDRFREVTPQLMEYYEFLEEKWRGEEDRFLELMVVDGCFLLECFHWRILPYDDPVNDIFRGTMMSNSRRDMFLIENQLPLQVLHILLELYPVEVQPPEDTMEQEELHDNGNFDIEDGSLPEFFNRLIHKDLGTGRRRSIIKLPPYITRSNPDAYIPEVVSIGPYHHGKEHLMPMEACKRNCFASFMKRSKCNPKRCYDRFREVTPQLMEYYEFLEEKWRREEDRFLELMVVDGCFLLECFYWRILPYDDPVNDIFRGTMMSNSRRDMFLIENQLPLQVLHILLELFPVEVQPPALKDLNLLISEFFGQKHITIDYSCVHLLDVLRVSMITRDEGPKAMITRVNEPIFFYRIFDAGPRLPSATLLSLAGLKFKKSITLINSRMDISFDETRGSLELPSIFVDELTETWFLNLMALERCEVMKSNGVSSYISFMGMLVRSAQDVKLLRKHGIIIDGKLEKSDDAIAKLFIELSNNPVNHPDDSLHRERSALEQWSARNRGKLNVRFAKWGSNFVETYCKNPWSAIGLVAGTILMVATVAQTVYAVLQFYQRENCPTPSHPLHP